MRGSQPLLHKAQEGQGSSKNFRRIDFLPPRPEKLHFKGEELKGLSQPGGFAWVFFSVQQRHIPLKLEKGQRFLFATDQQLHDLGHLSKLLWLSAALRSGYRSPPPPHSIAIKMLDI